MNATQVSVWKSDQKETNSDGRCLGKYRSYETTPEGQRRRRTKIIGTLGQYPTRADAFRRLERFRLRLNLQHRFGRPVTLDALIDHYVEKELPQLRYETQQAHLSSFKRWIRPRWGRCLLDRVKPMEVEQWLRFLPLATEIKGEPAKPFAPCVSAWTSVGDNGR